MVQVPNELDISLEVFNTMPELEFTSGVILFGSLEKEPPFGGSTYINPRLTWPNPGDRHSRWGMVELVMGLLDERVAGPAHGLIAMRNGKAILRWTSQDLNETMLKEFDDEE